MMKATVFDSGDPSVGIMAKQYEVECPFYKDTDETLIEWFRCKLAELYNETADGTIGVLYDFEIEEIKKTEHD